METKGFLPIRNHHKYLTELAPPNSFEYLCYGSTVIINIFTFTVRGSTLSDVYRRQLLSKVDPRTVRVKALNYFCINHRDQRVFSS